MALSGSKRQQPGTTPPLIPRHEANGGAHEAHELLEEDAKKQKSDNDNNKAKELVEIDFTKFLSRTEAHEASSDSDSDVDFSYSDELMTDDEDNGDAGS